jgi:hypothetical protein
MSRRLAATMTALSSAQEKQKYVDAFYRLLAGQRYFRWHDSGDLIDVAHLRLIVDIAARLPRVKFWLPTRECKVVNDYLRHYKGFPGNLTVRISAHMIDGPPPAVSLPTSGVHHYREPYGVACRCQTRGGSCGRCRKCWDASVGHISYSLH